MFVVKQTQHSQINHQSLEYEEKTETFNPIAFLLKAINFLLLENFLFLQMRPGGLSFDMDCESFFYKSSHCFNMKGVRKILNISKTPSSVMIFPFRRFLSLFSVDNRRLRSEVSWIKGIEVQKQFRAIRYWKTLRGCSKRLSHVIVCQKWIKQLTELKDLPAASRTVHLLPKKLETRSGEQEETFMFR